MSHQNKALCFRLLAKNRRSTDPLFKTLEAADELDQWIGDDPLKLIAVELICELNFHSSTGTFYLRQCCEEVYVYLRGPEAEPEDPTQGEGQAAEGSEAAEASESSSDDAETVDEEESGAAGDIADEKPKPRTPRRRGPRKSG